MIDPTGFMDLWTLLVVLTFGSFWYAVICLIIAMFVIMGPLGKISVYDCLVYSGLFLLIMSLGWGLLSIVNIMVELLIIGAFVLSLRGYIDRGGQ